MDELEYAQYLYEIQQLCRREVVVGEHQEPCRDERGDTVPGCSYTLPSPTYG